MNPDFSLDRLTAVNPARAGQAVMRLIDTVQPLSPEEQVAGVAMAFKFILDKYGVHAGNALQIAENILVRSYKDVPEIRAAHRYALEQMP